MFRKEITLFLETTLRRVAGIVFIGLGIVGLFVPFIQGILLIVLGAALLGSSMARKMLAKMHEKICAWWKR